MEWMGIETVEKYKTEGASYVSEKTETDGD